MPHEAGKLLADMKTAVDRILRFTTDRTFDDFATDDLLRSGVERQLENIGEAMTRLRQAFPEVASRISNQNKISGFRNPLIHGYDSIDDKITWGVVINPVPVLRRELELLIA
jgi:uncharacterized protein with HEPN domain